jgi:hypothetical protein
VIFKSPARFDHQIGKSGSFRDRLSHLIDPGTGLIVTTCKTILNDDFSGSLPPDGTAKELGE